MFHKQPSNQNYAFFRAGTIHSRPFLLCCSSNPHTACKVYPNAISRCMPLHSQPVPIHPTSTSDPGAVPHPDALIPTGNSSILHFRADKPRLSFSRLVDLYLDKDKTVYLKKKVIQHSSRFSFYHSSNDSTHKSTPTG